MRRVALCLTLTILFTACGHQAEAQPVSSRPTTLSSPVSSSCDRACWLDRIEQQRNERLWWAEVVKQQRAAVAYRRLLAFAAAVEGAKRAEEARAQRGSCGGSLPSCAILARESGGDHRIWNGGCYAPYGWRGSRAPNCPRARSSASGRWQIVRGTWAYCRTGYVNAADAPPSVQDDCARKIKRVQPSAWSL